MSEFQAYYTNDGSVGLYNNEFNDIYHSATGALTEAYEKFICPIDWYVLAQKNKIKLLDICYGIGYNTKSFLNFILNFKINFLKNNKYYAQIYSDNIFSSNKSIYNASIDTNNVFNNIEVTTVDMDNNLYNLSPFIKTGKLFVKNEKEVIDKIKVNKYVKNGFKFSKLKIDNLINFLILEKTIENNKEILTDTTLSNILNNKSNLKYFEANIRGIFEFYRNKYDSYKVNKCKLSYLHNIYYNHISYRYKKALKTYKLQDIVLKSNFMDARTFIKNDKNMYNLMFLDAFSPNKCPCLWSLEFFKELFSHLVPDGMLLTYSTSAAVRAAMINAGFKIGNIYNERLKDNIGTIAVKNEGLIKHPLSEFDFGLLKTRAGIFYRDENLNGQNEAIINRRNIEVNNSDLQSTSCYLKNCH